MTLIDVTAGSIPRFGLLGPLKVTDGEENMTVSSLLQRKVLTALLLAPRTVVSADALQFTLWGDSPPKTARKTLHTLVSRLRGLLEPGEIVTHPPGYMIEVEDTQVDSILFENLVNAADEVMPSDPEQGLGLIKSALDLWRGEAIAEFADEEFAMTEARRLDELRLVADELRFDGMLALGRHESVIPELEAFIATHPFREKPRKRLMIALYRSGRATDALDVYRQFRDLLVEELGLDPSSEIQELELKILTQDEDLGTVEPDQPPPLSIPSIAPVKTRLPQPPLLLGREGELDRLREMAREPLTTVVGPGGVGKTSLVSVWSDSTPGASVVELCCIEDAEELIPTMTQQLGMNAQTGDPRASLISRLSAIGGTLVIDNCEHLLEPVRDFVYDLQRSAPEMKVVCTSRQRLGLPGEQVLTLEPLHVGSDVSDLDELYANEAVRLFLDRAHRADSTHRVSSEHLPVVAEICRVLDGLPLAIELAAARAPVFGVEELLQQVTRDISVLEQGSGRHRSLVNVLDWSIGLLDYETRRVLATAALFEGGFELAHLVEVHAGPNPVIGLGRLVDASLVYRVSDSHPGRFKLHVPTRIHVRSTLETSQAARQRLVSWGRRFVGDNCRAMGYPNESASRRRLLAETGNVRAAARAALAHGDREAAFEIAEMLGRADLLGSPEIAGLVDEVADSYRERDGRFALGALAAAARSSAIRGRIGEAVARAEAAERTAENRSHRGFYMAVHARAFVTYFKGDAIRAAALLDEIVDDKEVPSPERMIAQLDQATFLAMGGDLERARPLAVGSFERAVTDAGESVISYGSYVLGTLDLCVDASSALYSFDSAVNRATEAGIWAIERIARVCRIAALMLLDRDEEALEAVPELIDDLVKSGNYSQLLALVRVVANLSMRSGDLETAGLLARAYEAHEEAPRFSVVVNATGQLDDLTESLSETKWEELGERIRSMTEGDVVGLVKEVAETGTSATHH